MYIKNYNFQFNRNCYLSLKIFMMKNKYHKKVKKSKKNKSDKKDSKKSNKNHKSNENDRKAEGKWEVESYRDNVKTSLSDFDILSIYADVSKLSAIESYLNLLYRPFTCLVRTYCSFKLSELDCLLSDTHYEPEMHSALVIRLSNPTCTIRLYDNGNIYCKGYSYESTALGIHRFISTMEHLGYSPSFQHPRFNVVNATFCMPFEIDLLQLSIEYCQECVYLPQTHPYLIFQIRHSIIRLAIFPVGYVYVMLAAQPRFTQKAIAFIMPILFRHRAAKRSVDLGMSIGDINFKLLWEHELQLAYQSTVNYTQHY